MITLVSLAMAQNVFFNLSSDRSRVHAIHKIIGVLGLGAAGCSLFSVSVLGEDKGLLLILTVFAIVGIGAYLQKLKKDRQRTPRKGPVPDALIRSQRPNENIEWCANCQAHTRRTYDVRSTGSLWEAWGRAVSSSSGNSGYTWKGARCSHCYSAILWNVPAEVRKITYGCGGCGLFLVVGIVSLLGWAAYVHDLENTALVIAICTLPILIPVFWLIYLHSSWIQWLKRQSAIKAGAESTSIAPQQLDPSAMSVADVLAAARSEVFGKSAAATPVVAEPTSTAPQKLDPSAMSVADILAAARDEGSGKSAATAPVGDASAATDEAESFEADRAAASRVDRESMSIDEILAHCRQVDG